MPLNKETKPINECLEYDTKPFDDETQILEL